MKTKYGTISKFVRALGAATWDVRAIPYCSSAGGFPNTSILTTDELLSGEKLRFYSHRNCCDDDIYVRPLAVDVATTRWVLLDDVSSTHIRQIKKLAPAAIVCSSPGNLQVWLRLPEAVSPEKAKGVSLALAQQFGADLRTATNPTQVGRLPGFTNRKPFHRVNDRAPLCVLIWSKDADAVISDSHSSPAFHRSTRQNPRSGGRDRSGADWKQICQMRESGVDQQAAFAWLLEHSAKAPQDERYCRLTVQKAYAV